MWLLLALLGTAGAAEVDVKSARLSERRSQQTYFAGWWAGLLGTGTRHVGTALDDSRLQLGGAIAQKTGVGIMLTAGVNGRRAINAQGGDVGGGWAAVGWTMWTVSGAIDFGRPKIAKSLDHLDEDQVAIGLDLARAGTTLCTYVLAVSQHRRNRIASRRLATKGQTKGHWTLRPVASSPFTGGVIARDF